jgi:hypothetical protein
MLTKMCEMLVLKNGNQEVACHVTLTNGQILVAPEPGYQLMARNLMEEAKQEDAAKWFHSLPHKYTGASLRAKIL